MQGARFCSIPILATAIVLLVLTYGLAVMSAERRGSIRTIQHSREQRRNFLLSGALVRAYPLQRISKKWDADYGQEKATTSVLRFHILKYKLMSSMLIATPGLLFIAREISLTYCLTSQFCAFTVNSDLETV